jgi:Fe-S-cluster containining protein
VVALEAYDIEQALVAERRHGPPAWNRTGRGCVLLCGRRCGVYAHRPLICRTHGLLIREEGALVRTCPKNVAGMDAAMIEAGLVFDSERITANLVRLNYAFCAAKGIPELAGRRIPLRDLLAGPIDDGRSG